MRFSRTGVSRLVNQFSRGGYPMRRGSEGTPTDWGTAGLGPGKSVWSFSFDQSTLRAFATPSLSRFSASDIAFVTSFVCSSANCFRISLLCAALSRANSRARVARVRSHCSSQVFRCRAAFSSASPFVTPLTTRNLLRPEWLTRTSHTFHRLFRWGKFTPALTRYQAINSGVAQGLPFQILCGSSFPAYIHPLDAII